MYWFTRPSYLRWAAAGLLLAAALFIELRPTADEPYPFAARDLESGHRLTDEDIDWRRVPAGLMAPPNLDVPILRRAVAAGEPVTATSVGPLDPVPDGWWAVSLPLPGSARAGTPVRLVLTDPVTVVEGVVVAAATSDAFALEPQGLVAVPGDASSLVAAAGARGDVVVMVAP